MKGLRKKFWKWKESSDSKNVKVNLGKTKVVVSRAEGELYGYGNSVLCVKWIQGR